VAILKKFSYQLSFFKRISFIITFLGRYLLFKDFAKFFNSHPGVECLYTFFIRSLASKNGNVANKANLLPQMWLARNSAALVCV